jgi:hypothetical protein
MERCGLGKFMIHVDGIEVAAQAGKIDDVRLRDRPPCGLPLLADFQVVEIQMICGKRHEPKPPARHTLMLSLQKIAALVQVLQI